MGTVRRLLISPKYRTELTDRVSLAAANAFDVVLVDTAGRMQDNEPLMRALAKVRYKL